MHSSKTLTYIHSSGDKPYRLLINIENETLRVKIGGSWPYRDSAAFWCRIHEECSKHELARALVMFRLNEPLALRDAYALAARASETFEESTLRTAVVDLSERSFSNPGFWSTAVGVDCGMKSFTSIEDAEHWLLSASE